MNSVNGVAGVVVGVNQRSRLRSRRAEECSLRNSAQWRHQIVQTCSRHKRQVFDISCQSDHRPSQINTEGGSHHHTQRLKSDTKRGKSVLSWWRVVQSQILSLVEIDHSSQQLLTPVEQDQAGGVGRANRTNHSAIERILA